MKTERSLELHPAGEDDFVFPTYGGMVRLSATDDALTPLAGWCVGVIRIRIERVGDAIPVARRKDSTVSPIARPTTTVPHWLQVKEVAGIASGRRAEAGAIEKRALPA